MKYHKLVRNRIPEMIEKDGSICCWQHIPNDQFTPLLEEKAVEVLTDFRV